MNCLLTGSSGFIGSRLLPILCNYGFIVSVISRSKIAGQKTFICDFENDQIPKDAFKSIDVVFHLAGLAHDTRKSKYIEESYRKMNVDLTFKLARLAADSGVKKFVFISSVKAGGSPAIGSFSTELNQNDPISIYGKTKREAELLLLEIGKESAMHISIIRPALVYGPNVKGNLKLMLSGIKKGWFPPLPKMDNRRSMIHVDDLVRAILMVSMGKFANNEIFIATDGSPYSSDEIYNVMCKVIGKKIPKWRVPKIIFYFATLLGPNIKHKINKLFGDEYYSSTKLESLGFKAKKTLQNMNETDF